MSAIKRQDSVLLKHIESAMSNGDTHSCIVDLESLMHGPYCKCFTSGKIINGKLELTTFDHESRKYLVLFTSEDKYHTCNGDMLIPLDSPRQLSGPILNRSSHLDGLVVNPFNEGFYMGREKLRSVILRGLNPSIPLTI